MWYRKKEELVDADYVIETAVSVPEVLKNIHKIIKHKVIKVSIVIFTFITYCSQGLN